MKISNFFTKTTKNISKKAESKNHELLVRAGYVDQLMAGVYTYLPLGKRVLENIENIVREEMVAIDGQEILMPALQPKENWAKTGRWDTMDDLYRFTSYYSKNEVVLGGTHEEVVTPLTKKFIFSYKDLPKYVFQIQTKFRDEKRAKSGILRGREFRMKDLYSFHADEKDLDAYYDKAINSYKKIFKRFGLDKETYLTFASGGTFSKFSHEFQTESPVGEDSVYVCRGCKMGINKEIILTQKQCPGCGKTDLEEIKTIEVANIFKLKTKFTDTFKVNYLDKDGKEKPVYMGCYGIGPSRIMGAIVEVLSDKKGIIWPKEITPYHVHLVDLNMKEAAEKLTKALEDASIEVLWDDREESAGNKFADADLLGIPIRVVVSEKSGKAGGFEFKLRGGDEVEIMNEKELIKKIKEFYVK
jgi:prolyl-tRNA synthetase